MTQWLFPPAPTPSLPIDGDARRLPVRRILCVGQNYAAHAREMGADPDRPAPFFFAKPGDALVADGADPTYPSATQNLHYEVELVVALGAGRPCAAGRALARSAPGGAISRTPPGADAVMELEVNAAVHQSSRRSDMVCDVHGVLSKASELWAVQPGDLIFAGTPEGVGPL